MKSRQPLKQLYILNATVLRVLGLYLFPLFLCLTLLGFAASGCSAEPGKEESPTPPQDQPRSHAVSPQRDSAAAPANEEEARLRLAELLAQEYAFKQNAAGLIAGARANMDNRQFERLLDYLWLISLNPQRYERTIAQLAKTGDHKQRGQDNGQSDEDPLNGYEYFRLLRSFQAKLYVQQAQQARAAAYEAERAGDKPVVAAASPGMNEKWFHVWEEKAREREFSPFLENFLTQRYGRWVLDDNEELALALWPLRADTNSLRIAQALYTGAEDRFGTLDHLRTLAAGEPGTFAAALQQMAQQRALKASLDNAAGEIISLAIAPHFPDFARQALPGGSEKISVNAAVKSLYAPKEGTLPNSVRIRRLEGATAHEVIDTLPSANILVGISEKLPMRFTQTRLFMADTPLENVLREERSLLPALRERDFLDAHFLDSLSGSKPISIFLSRQDQEVMTRHISSLGLAFSERETRIRAGEKGLIAPQLHPAGQRKDAQHVLAAADPEGVALRLADPLNALYMLSLLEHASSQQAQRIMGPLDAVLVYLPGEGWFSIEPGQGMQDTQTAGAQKSALFIPALSEEFLRILVQRYDTFMENTYINKAASILLSPEDRKQGKTLAASELEKIALPVRGLRAMLDAAQVAPPADREVYYSILLYTLQRNPENTETLLNAIQKLLQEDLTPEQRTAKTFSLVP